MVCAECGIELGYSWLRFQGKKVCAPCYADLTALYMLKQKEERRKRKRCVDIKPKALN